MSTRYDNVIVFGPTGDVGGIAAAEASKLGANVWLAMRDTTKAITNITEEQEKQGSFTRVQANLTDADSVRAAVQKSGAKAAFIYLVPSPKGLKESVQALKDGGIEYVVFLSSYSIRYNDLRKINMAEDIIAFSHAQVEIALEDCQLPHFALRPGFFASNSLRHNLDTSKSEWGAVMMRNVGLWDNISPIDIGRVAGTVLVNRPSSSSKESAFLCGPKLLTQDEMWDAIQKAASKDITVTYVSAEDYRQNMLAKGVPAHFADYLVKELKNVNGDNQYPGDIHKDGVANVEKYLGSKSQSFVDYLAESAP